MYFKSDFPDQPFFHIDYFLDDLVGGKKRYSSSLLINALLAIACVSASLADLDPYQTLNSIVAWPNRSPAALGVLESAQYWLPVPGLCEAPLGARKGRQ
jgi:hypothetical protein